VGAFFQSYIRVLALRTETFDELRLSRHSLSFVFSLFILVGLFAGLGTLSGMGGMLETPTAAERVYGAAGTVDSWAEGQQGFVARLVSGPAASVSGWLRELGATLESFEPPLGVRPSRVIRLIGAWLTSPLTLLAAWMSAILPVLLVAKFMGTGGGLRPLVTLLLLSVAPWILTLGSAFPIPEGSAWQLIANGLRIVAMGWGLAILVKGLAVAGGIDQRRAVTILVATALVFYIVIPSILLSLGGLKLWLLIQLLRP
jgi:hypothetical protein